MNEAAQARGNTLRGEATAAGTLESIQMRIENFARQTREIGHKLNQHADSVHGSAPIGHGGEKPEHDRAPGLISRIFEALEDLDNAGAYMAEAAGRNTTLA